MAQTEKKLPELVKQSDTFKIKVPKDVEEKIRHLCRCCPTVEWSGKLFYTTEGSIEEKNLMVTCKDLYVMDIGTGGYTEFDETPDFFGYMVEKDLMDCNIGLIHSHNNMATFFSGTDLSTLKEEGNDNNHFVSLIVNNAGSYTAAVTRKMDILLDVKATKSYRTFDNSEVAIDGEEVWQQKTARIEYFMLDVDKEEVPSVYNELDARLNEIRKAKAEAKAKKVSTYEPKPKSVFNYDGFGDWSYRPNEDYNYNNRFEGHSFTSKKVDTRQPSLFRDDEIESHEPGTIEIDETLIENIVLQLITGSVVIDSTSDVKAEDSAKNMVSLFDNRFNKSIEDSNYAIWTEIFTDFLIEEATPDGLTAEDEKLYVSELCSEIISRLDELPKNIYLDYIIETLMFKMDY